jgi:1,2-beta-oligoglucan phosphorylase
LRHALPIAVTERLAHALCRQRNAYFSSNDAAFPDRYAASNDWQQVQSAKIGVEGGWRIYSSGQLRRTQSSEKNIIVYAGR